MRMDLSETEISISVSNYIQENISENLFTSVYEEFLKKYKDNVLLSLAKLHPDFHYKIMKEHIEGKSRKDTTKLIQIYEDLNIFIFYDSFLNNNIIDAYGRVSKSNPIGYKSNKIAFIYVNDKWKEIPLSLLLLSTYTEMEWVGFTKPNLGMLDFKLRYGII